VLNSLRRDFITLQQELDRLAAEAQNEFDLADAIIVRPGDDISTSDVQAMLSAARQSAETLVRLEERYEAVGAVLADTEQESLSDAHRAATERLAQAEQARGASVADAEPDLESVNSIESAAKLKRDQLIMLAASQGAAKERLETLQRARAETDDAAERLEGLNLEIADLRYMELMYGRDGIPALLLEGQAIPQIEQEAERVLRALGTNFRVELRTQRDLKTDADRKKETLDVIVSDDAGERSYASFSGGERTRINLALRIGLARLIASRKGADMRTLCLDEPEFLDAEGLRRLPEVLRCLTEFDTVLVISHDEALSDQFDQTVTVVRDGERSTVQT
jgi:exonuclease SbcC